MTINFKIIKFVMKLFFSLKTGFGKYVGFDSEAYLIATADAIGARERFDVVFQSVILMFFGKIIF